MVSGVVGKKEPLLFENNVWIDSATKSFYLQLQLIVIVRATKNNDPPIIDVGADVFGFVSLSTSTKNTFDATSERLMSLPNPKRDRRRGFYPLVCAQEREERMKMR